MNSLAVSPDEHGTRLDALLSNRLEEISRTRIKALILEGAVSVNDEPCRVPGKKLRTGDSVSVTIPDPVPAEPEPQAIELDILFEDDDLLVVNKPPGMVVHPAPGNWSGTLVNALLHHCGPQLQGIGGVRRPGIVHRLDRDTSGVMIVAKSQKAHTDLAAQFADHGRNGPLRRHYLALVWDMPQPASGTVDAPLGRSTSHRTKRSVVSPTASDARSAITHYKTLATTQNEHENSVAIAMVECRLETGRTHQIRVHMAHIGHPLLGDPDYGAHYRTKSNRLSGELKDYVDKLGRQALHAASLRFRHPLTGQAMEFDAPVPEDMNAIIGYMRT